jgi:hypothetical protein
VSTLAIVQVTSTAHGAQHAPGGLDPIPGVSSLKSGSITPGYFTGHPLTAVVQFSTPFPDTNYAVTLAVTTDGSKTFAPSVSNKTAAGFSINLNTNNVANLIEVGWHCLPNGS